MVNQWVHHDSKSCFRFIALRNIFNAIFSDSLHDAAARLAFVKYDTVANIRGTTLALSNNNDYNKNIENQNRNVEGINRKNKDINIPLQSLTPPPLKSKSPDVDNYLPALKKDTTANAPKKKVAFAITITNDGSVLDGACVLVYSIIKAHKDTKIDISFVAFVHPIVEKAIEPLKKIGFQ